MMTRRQQIVNMGVDGLADLAESRLAVVGGYLP
jgi:hypothetical protein